jgi:hypothetical protein
MGDLHQSYSPIFDYQSNPNDTLVCKTLPYLLDRNGDEQNSFWIKRERFFGEYLNL